MKKKSRNQNEKNKRKTKNKGEDEENTKQSKNQRHYEYLLYESILEGDITKVKEYSKFITDINFQTPHGNCLTTSVYLNHFEIVQFLLTKKIDYKKKNDEGYSILHLSINNLPMLKFLMKRLINKININETIERTGENLLHLSLNEKVINITKISYLIDIGVDVNGATTYCESVLTLAARSGNLDVLRLIFQSIQKIENNINNNIHNINNNTVHNSDCKDNNTNKNDENNDHNNINNQVNNVKDNTNCNDNININNNVSNHKENPNNNNNKKKKNNNHNNKKNINNNNSNNNQKTNNKKIINNNTNNKEKDERYKEINERVLLSAIMGKSLECVKYLIENGANINAKTKSGENILYCCAQRRKFQITKYILELTKGKFDYNDNSFLPIFLSYANKEETNYILSLEEINFSSSNNNGIKKISILHLIINTQVSNRKYKFQKIISHPTCDINEKTFAGDNVLHLCARNFSSLWWAKELIKHGVNITAKNNDGETALHHAIKFTNEIVFNYLISLDLFDLEEMSNNGLNALHFSDYSPQFIPLILFHSLNLPLNVRKMIKESGEQQEKLSKVDWKDFLFRNIVNEPRIIYLSDNEDILCPFSRSNVQKIVIKQTTQQQRVEFPLRNLPKYNFNYETKMFSRKID